MPRRFAPLFLVFAMTTLAVAPLRAQPAASPPRVLQPRALAPGVLTTIPPLHEEVETFSGPREFVEITRGNPNLSWNPQTIPKTETLIEKSRIVTFRRGIWCLEFSFKPMRMVYVDIPQPTGKFERTLVWYMVYRVRNLGRHLAPQARPDQFGHNSFVAQEVNHEVRFFPSFVLESYAEGREGKGYLDRLIPVAAPVIQEREDPAIKLHNSVEITRISIPVSQEREDRSVWGVATWTDIDLNTDFFSIFIEGLTNAHEFDDPEGAFTPGSPPGTGRVFRQRELRLNFWRPGDDINPHEEEIFFGIPVLPNPEEQERMLGIYGIPARVDFEWIYR